MAAGYPTVRGHGWVGWGPVALALALFVGFLSLAPNVAAGQAPVWILSWVPQLGIDLAFRVDGLSLTFALLISGIGVVVLLYANSYLASDRMFRRFVLFLSAFMLAMLGLVLADDLIALFVFWELTTITSYLLIGYTHDKPVSRRNALQALFLTGAGALAFLAGLIILGNVAGTFRISEILTQGDMLRAHPMYGVILLLFLAGAFTKSAQVPFHFWLPNAMAAPTPVSAFLHSATMVKAGVYLLARMHPAMSGTDAWVTSLTLLGGATAVFASILALRQTDLKLALAYTTLMALGTLTMLLGQNSAYAMTAFATFLVVHSLYKAALFLVVGNLDAATGTRDTHKLAALGPVMPVTALVAALAGLSMAGVPPFLGFIAKELQYAATTGLDSWSTLVTAAALAANALMVTVALIVALKPFWMGWRDRTPVQAQVPWPMVVGPLALGSAGLAFGLLSAPAQIYLVNPTVDALTGGTLEPKELKLWAGVNLPLILSGVTLTLGLVMFIATTPLRRMIAGAEERLPNFDANWDRFMDGLKGVADGLTARVQTGRMTDYMMVTFGTVAVGILGTAALRGLPDLARFPEKLGPLNFALVALILVGTALTVGTRSRITGIAALGVVGIGVALVFIFFGAPDVAITQLMVEVLVVVLIAVVMLRLPRLPSHKDRPRRLRVGHAVISLGVGASVTLILLAILGTPLDRSLTTYFETTSWPEAYGRNIVNVILVDFRALDTFGEVAVVVIAAISAMALLRQSRKDPS